MIQKIIDFINKNAGLLVAILALIVAIYESYRRRRHDRLSVQPVIEGKAELFKEKAEVFLLNVGLGPARITEYKIYVDGNEIDRMDTAFKNFSEKLKLPESLIQIEKFSLPSVFRQNDRITLFCATPPCGALFELSELGIFFSILNKIIIKIKYESLYKKRSKDTIHFNVFENPD